MKLIPQVTKAPEIPKQPVDLAGHATAVRRPNKVTADTEMAESKVSALAYLNNMGQSFSETLERTVKKISRLDAVTPALALAALLEGTTSMLRSMLDGLSANKGEMNETKGHAGSRAKASDCNRNTRDTGSRTTARVAGNRKVTSSDSGDAPKRGRGRPPGSRNKATLAKLAAQRAAKRASKPVVAVVKKAKKAASANKPAAAVKPAARAVGKGGGKGRSKGTRKAGERKR